jgi:Uma2 family endonuclease
MKGKEEAMSTPIMETLTEPRDLLDELDEEVPHQERNGHEDELPEVRREPRDMGAKSSEVAANVIRIVGQHAHTHKAGKVFATDCGYKIFADQPRKVIFPDMSFIGKDRLPENKTPRGYVTIAPDLATEVISPNDLAQEVEEKRVLTLRAGTRLVWLFYPATQTVHVHRPNGTCTILTSEMQLSGEDVLPGFTCNVAEFFEES